MVKPDGVKRYLSNMILSKIIGAGFKVSARKRMTMTPEQAEKLYAVHKGKPFYDSLVKFITSGAGRSLQSSRARTRWRR